MSYRAAGDESGPIFIATSGHVLALDRESGEIVWKTAMGNHSHLALLVDRERIFAVGHGVAGCLRGADGSMLWKHDIELMWPVSLALDEAVPGGRLFIVGAGLAYALVADSGQQLWHNGLKGLGYNPISLRVPGAKITAGATMYRSGKHSQVYHEGQGSDG